MAEARRAALVAASPELVQHVTRSLCRSGYDATVTSPKQFVDAVESGGLEAAASSAIPAEVEALVCGDAVFPEGDDPDECLARGMRNTFVLVKSALRVMIRRRSGRIVVLAPSLNTPGLPHQAVRVGLSGFIKSVAREVGTRGITANVISPGHLDGSEREPLPHLASGRNANSKDIAEMVAVALGDGGQLTGQVLRVDGGLDMT